MNLYEKLFAAVVQETSRTVSSRIQNRNSFVITGGNGFRPHPNVGDLCRSDRATAEGVRDRPIRTSSRTRRVLSPRRTACSARAGCASRWRKHRELVWLRQPHDTQVYPGQGKRHGRDRTERPVGPDSRPSEVISTTWAVHGPS